MELYLPILDKYLCENFLEYDEHYHIKEGGYISRLINSHYLNNVDADDLVGEITVWFCLALDDYSYDEVMVEDFDVPRNSYVYQRLKMNLLNHLKYLQIRQRPIPAKKRHMIERQLIDSTSADEDVKIDLSVLTPNEKLVVDGFYYENMTITQISKIINKSEKTVKRLKRAALEKLSSKFKSSQ